MRLKKVELKQIKKFLQKIPGIIVEHFILAFLCLAFLSFGIGSILFYQYAVLPEKVEQQVLEKPGEFKEKVEQEILKEWEVREKKFKEVDFKVYLNPFLEKREILKPEKQEEQKPEEPKEEQAEQKTEMSQGAKNLFEFYIAKGENLPSIEERAGLWEKLGLGKAEEYQGLYFQNIKLLEKLTK